MNKTNARLQPAIFTLTLLLVLITTACSRSQIETDLEVTPAVPTPEPVSASETEAAYPSFSPTATTEDSGYPAPARAEGLLDTPPDPVRNFPDIPTDRGVVGGVLVQQVTEDGYRPVTPLALGLGDYLKNDRGEASFIRYNDSSPHAQIFNTGVFMFSDVEPGIYALVINLGFAQFVIQNEAGFDLVVEVEAGKATDLGQVFVRLPED